VRADTIYKTVRKYWAERIKVAMCKFRAECGHFWPTSPLPAKTTQYVRLISVQVKFWLMRRCAS